MLQILDEYLQFLDGGNKARHSGKILDVGVQKALSQVEWDQEAFVARGAIYDWGKECGEGACGGGLEGIDMKDLEF